MADMSRFFRLQVISPDRIFYDGDVEMVELRTSEGEMGVLKGHIPLTAILVPGVLKIKEACRCIHLHCSGAFRGREMFGLQRSHQGTIRASARRTYSRNRSLRRIHLYCGGAFRGREMFGLQRSYQGAIQASACRTQLLA